MASFFELRKGRKLDGGFKQAIGHCYRNLRLTWIEACGKCPALLFSSSPARLLFLSSGGLGELQSGKYPHGILSRAVANYVDFNNPCR